MIDIHCNRMTVAGFQTMFPNALSVGGSAGWSVDSDDGINYDASGYQYMRRLQLSIPQLLPKLVIGKARRIDFTSVLRMWFTDGSTGPGIMGAGIYFIPEIDWEASSDPLKISSAAMKHTVTWYDYYSATNATPTSNIAVNTWNWNVGSTTLWPLSKTYGGDDWDVGTLGMTVKNANSFLRFGVNVSDIDGDYMHLAPTYGGHAVGSLSVTTMKYWGVFFASYHTTGSAVDHHWNFKSIRAGLL